jgi:hypothetical protein
MKKIYQLAFIIIVCFVMTACSKKPQTTSSNLMQEKIDSSEQIDTDKTNIESSEHNDSNITSDATDLDEDTAMNILSGVLSDIMQDNTAIVSYGEDVVNGEKCWIFAFGKNTSEKFTAEDFYAVTNNGYIYILDFISNEYVPYEPEYYEPNDYDFQGQGNVKVDEEWISFMTQEYVGNNIAEIPYFEYAPAENSEIDSINRSLVQGIQQKYDNFMATTDENSWIEIKSYPFSSDNYLQVVITDTTFPNYGLSDTMFSLNYNRNTGKIVTVDDILNEYNLSQDNVNYQVGQLFIPSVSDELIENVELSGFLIYENADPGLELLLTITTTTSSSEPLTTFYSYIPQLSELIQLNSFCLFDPYDMDQMDPPLYYQY